MAFRYLIEDEPNIGEGVDPWRKWRKSLDKLPADDEGVIAAKRMGDEMIRELEKLEAGSRKHGK